MDAFIGEIRILPYGFTPQNWADCNGQKLLIQSYPALYSIIGNIYGPADQTSFTLPNLQGQVLMGTSGTNSPPLIASKAGAESVALNITQIASHTHTVNAKVSTTAPATNMSTAPNTNGTSWLSRAVQISGTTSSPVNAYTPPGSPNSVLAAQVFGPAGSGAAHENRQPYLPMRFCICISEGAYPIRN